MISRYGPLLAGCLVPAAAHAQLGSTSADTNARPFYGEVAMIPGTTYAAGRSLKAACSAPGNVSLTYSDGSTGVWAAVTGTQTFPVEAVAVNTSTTAICSYANLK